MQTCSESRAAPRAVGDRAAAIILSGSREADTASLDAALPRLNWPIANQSLIEHLREWLASAEVRSLVICTNDAQQLVSDMQASSSASRVAVSFYEDRVPRGPAGAARDAALLTHASDFLLVEGVALPDIDLPHLLTAHRDSAAAATVVVQPAALATDRGAGLSSPAGVYVFSREALLRVPAGGYRDIKEVLIPELHRSGQTVGAYATSRAWPRLDSLRSYLAAQQWLLERWQRDGAAPAGYAWRGQACLHESARLSRSARLLGPVMVGCDAHVEDEVILLGPVVIGARCRVGRAAVVGRSVLWDGCHVGAGARLEECVVACGEQIEAGAAARGVVSGVDRTWMRN